MDLFKAIQGVSSWSSADGHPSDLFDRLTYRVTSFIMMLLVAIIGLKSYVFKPIQCALTESNTLATPGFEQYAENMCWIENIFRLTKTDISYTRDGQQVRYSSVDFDMQNKIKLYQWTPMVLGIQAFFCYLPYILWTVMQQRAGINLNTIISAVTRANSTCDSENRKKEIAFAARVLDECLLMQRKYRNGCTAETRIFLGKIFPFFNGKRSGYLLTFSYVFVKLLFVAMPVAQIWFMSRYIGVSSMFFGFEIFFNCTLNINGSCNHMGDSHYTSTGLFPLRAGCLVPIHWNGPSYSEKTIYWDCALPINFILEKVYVFLWGWFAFIFVLNLYSLFFWLFKLFVPGKRRHFVKKFMRLLKVHDYDNKHARRDFIDKKIRLDGVFTLRLVSEIAGDMAAACILKSMWEQYLITWNLPNNSKRTPKGSTCIEMNQLQTGLKLSANGTNSSLSNQSPETPNKPGQLNERLLNTYQIAGYPQS